MINPSSLSLSICSHYGNDLPVLSKEGGEDVVTVAEKEPGRQGMCVSVRARACARIPLFPHFSKESSRELGEFDGALILFNLDYRVADSKDRSRSWSYIPSVNFD